MPIFSSKDQRSDRKLQNVSALGHNSFLDSCKLLPSKHSVRIMPKDIWLDHKASVINDQC